MGEHTQRLPAVRELYREVSSGKLYRVVHADRGFPDVVLCYLFGSTLRLLFIPFQEFCARSTPGYAGEDRWVYEDPRKDPYGQFRRSARSTLANDKQSALNWQRIASIVEDSLLFYRSLRSGSDRKNILQDAADASGVTIQRIRKLHREYMQRGMTEDAVAGELWRCGRRHQPPRYVDGEDAESTIIPRKYNARPGRTPAGSERGRYAIRTEALEQLFEQYIDIFLTSKIGPWKLDVSEELMNEIRAFNREALFPATRKSKKATKEKSLGKGRLYKKSPKRRPGKRARVIWQDLVDHLNYVCRCVRQVRDSTGQIVELQLAPFGIMRRRQLTYYYNTRVPIEVRKQRSMGAKEYFANGRPIRGHALQHSIGPGMEYMIDATIADMYLVSSYDRTVVIKRPTIYLAMDVWSRMIVGFYVSYDPPSFESIALMLENIATPKQEICARYGIDIASYLWPCEYLPLSGFLADRGSDLMKTATWQAINKKLATPISNVRAWDPVMRALVERRFGILPAQYQRASFGVVEADAAMRGAPKYAWDATLTITEFTKKLVRAILRYNQTPIGREGAVPQMVASGLADTPLNRWHWGLDNLTGSLRRHSLDEIRCATWPTEMAHPTARGLRWRGAYYTSPIIDSKYIHCWGRDAKKPVPIQFNPNDPSRIILAGDDHLEYAQLAATNKQTPGDGTLMEWEVYRHLAKRVANAQHDALESQRVMDLLNNCEEDQVARRQQRVALKQAGLSHPVQKDRKGAGKNSNGASVEVDGFGKFKINKKRRDMGGHDRSTSGDVISEDAGEEDAIVESLKNNTRRILG